MKRTDLRKRGEGLRLACHRAVTVYTLESVRLAADLSRRAMQLNAVAPKLRAKGASKAVQMFLMSDAVTPAALVSLNSDRTGRQFCDRLVELGAVHELTGRDRFRLYGIKQIGDEEIALRIAVGSRAAVIGARSCSALW